MTSNSIFQLGYTIESFVKCRDQKEWVCDSCMKCGDKNCCPGDHAMYRVPKTEDCLCSICLAQVT
jgi:hypothetical protein